MTKIVAILNPKGGSGKTTLAIHLARCLHLSGERTLLVDSDIQGSARDWSAAGNGEGPSVIGLDRPTIEKDLPSVGIGYDWIVIDGASKLEKMIASAVKAADLILIPLQPSPLDLWACASLIDVIQARQSATDGRPACAFVITRAKKNTIIAREAGKVIGEYGIPILHGSIMDRTLFARSLSEGSTAIDREPAGPAAFEIKHMLKQVRDAFS